MNKKDILKNKYKNKIKGIWRKRIYDYVINQSFMLEDWASDMEFNNQNKYTWIDEYEEIVIYFIDLLNGENIETNLKWLKLTKEDLI